MATINLTDTATTLDPGTGFEVFVINIGGTVAYVRFGGYGGDVRLDPGESTSLRVGGQVVTAFVRSGTGTLDVTAVAAPTAPSGSGTSVLYVGTNAAPVTTAGTARPSTAGPVYWVCANGVTPSNAISGDIVFNKSA